MQISNVRAHIHWRCYLKGCGTWFRPGPAQRGQTMTSFIVGPAGSANPLQSTPFIKLHPHRERDSSPYFSVVQVFSGCRKFALIYTIYYSTSKVIFTCICAVAGPRKTKMPKINGTGWCLLPRCMAGTQLDLPVTGSTDLIAASSQSMCGAHQSDKQPTHSICEDIIDGRNGV